MKTLIIACETLRDELTAAQNVSGVDYPVVWVEQGLHNYPDKLRVKLQEKIDSVCEALPGAQRVLLAFGYCGNSVAGIKNGNFELIIPRVDDCITLLLGSYDRRASAKNTYFLTKGWLQGESNIWTDYKYTMKKYGPETGKMIMDMMLEHYTDLGILDTGAYPLDDFAEETKTIAQTLNLTHKVLPASFKYLTELLTGPWQTERFLHIVPGQEIVAGMLTMGT